MGGIMNESRQSDWKMYRERGIGDRGGMGSRPALLIVDVTNGFTDPPFFKAFGPGSLQHLRGGIKWGMILAPPYSGWGL